METLGVGFMKDGNILNNQDEEEENMTDKGKNETGKTNSGNPTEPEVPPKAKIRWDAGRMTSSYANVCNVNSTREEVTLLFGTNQAWNPAQAELTVEVNHRVILNPYAAKRLALALSNVMKEYESRFGELKIDAGEPGKVS
jgi:hypothetical protein